MQVYTESQTLARRKTAEIWVKRRETDLSEPGAIEREQKGGVLLKDVIDQHLQEVAQATPLGTTQEATLRGISRCYLGELGVHELTSQVLVDYALWRMSAEGGNVQPQTAGNDLAHLGAVLGVARPAWGYDVPVGGMADARRVLSKLGYKLKSRERDHCPEKAEVAALLERFSDGLKFRPTSIAMPKIVLFALFSTRWGATEFLCAAGCYGLVWSRRGRYSKHVSSPKSAAEQPCQHFC